MNEIGKFILETRCFQQGEDWERLCKRVAWSHAESAEEAEAFYEMIFSMKGMPSSPILMNSGVGEGSQKHGFLSSCNLVPIPDDMAGIFDAMKVAGLIQKHGGGVGFNFSKLRPAGDIIGSTGGTSSGPIAFLKMLDAVSDAVKQGGKRRGANIGVIAQWHPDIYDFINVKNDLNLLKAFNLSVGVTGDIFGEEDIVLINPRDHEVVGSTKADDLLTNIACQIWDNGEPGVVFWDTIQKDNPTPWLGDLQGLNPCGEVPLYHFESCVLGSINLYAHLIETDSHDFEVDVVELQKTARTMVSFLNRVIDNNVYPIPEMKEAALRTRKIGMGVMGYADMLAAMNLEYGSEDAMTITDWVMSVISNSAIDATYALAVRDGPYPSYRSPAPFQRNATLLSIAPTGSISYISDVSSGIEPIFDLAYIVNSESSGPKLSICRSLRDRLSKLPMDEQDRILTGILSGLSFGAFITSDKISPETHIQVQALFQRYVDQSISKTINLPTDTTPSQVKDLLRFAYEQGLKGITMFRAGCRRDSFLTKPVCPSCGDSIIHKEGCLMCRSCSWGACTT